MLEGMMETENHHLANTHSNNCFKQEKHQWKQTFVGENMKNRMFT